MSVGAIKKILLLANLTAVGLLLLVGWSMVRQRSSLKEAWKRPDFVPAILPAGEGDRIGNIENVTMKLGRFPEPTSTTTDKPTEEAQPVIESVLARIGTIIGAIVVYPPYDSDGLQPAIIFELKGKTGDGARRSVTLGQGLMEKPDPDPERAFHGYTVPAAYMFVGCEPDPEHPGWTYFLFDMKCDGTDIQKARWKGEEPAKPFDAAAPNDPNSPTYEGSGKGFYIGDPNKARTAPVTPGKPENPDETAKTGAVPTPPEPVPAPVPFEGPSPDRLFDEEDGTLAPTRDAVEYLKQNYNDVLKDARTTTYVDPKTRQARGIQILGIRSGSVANKFGVLPDDVILSINGQPVTRQAQAVTIVKRELNNNKTIIEVRILRRGKEITQRYDTRDPDVRRNAKDILRKRPR